MARAKRVVTTVERCKQGSLFDRETLKAMTVRRWKRIKERMASEALRRQQYEESFFKREEGACPHEREGEKLGESL